MHSFISLASLISFEFTLKHLFLFFCRLIDGRGRWQRRQCSSELPLCPADGEKNQEQHGCHRPAKETLLLETMRLQRSLLLWKEVDMFMNDRGKWRIQEISDYYQNVYCHNGGVSNLHFSLIRVDIYTHNLPV